ncbi:MAG: Crp/Fnr family transcriptional regulator [Eubacteriales bacterium]
MNQYINVLRTNPLFGDISESELMSMLVCLNMKERSYKKKEMIVMAGQSINFVGVVIDGSVKIIKEDMDGNEVLLTEIGRGELFGEVFACAGITKSPVTIQTSEHTRILLLDYYKVISTCEKNCVFHKKLTENMLKILADKNLILNQKIEVISKKSLREKIMCYLVHQSKGRKRFTIPFNREALANYLCADRSAVSNELSKMQKDGVIRYKKNEFEITSTTR